MNFSFYLFIFRKWPQRKTLNMEAEASNCSGLSSRYCKNIQLAFLKFIIATYVLKLLIYSFVALTC
jgi:hypothetical protein